MPSAKQLAEKAMGRPFPTIEEVDFYQSGQGGWSHDSLRKLGVPVPPPQGWRRAIARLNYVFFVEEHHKQEDQPVARIVVFVKDGMAHVVSDRKVAAAFLSSGKEGAFKIEPECKPWVVADVFRKVAGASNDKDDPNNSYGPGPDDVADPG